MKTFPLKPKLDSEKQAVDQGILQGLYASKLSLPHEKFEEMLRSATELWERNGTDLWLIQLGVLTARAAYRGEKSWAAQAHALSLDEGA